MLKNIKQIVLILTILLAATAAVARGPKIVFDPGDMWVGTLPGDTMVTFKVAVRNDGDRPLEIYRINKSCRCTQVTFPDTVAPHAADTAVFTVDTRKIAPGNFTNYVTFVTNDQDYTKRYYYSGEILITNDK